MNECKCVELRAGTWTRDWEVTSLEVRAEILGVDEIAQEKGESRKRQRLAGFEGDASPVNDIFSQLHVVPGLTQMK